MKIVVTADLHLQEKRVFEQAPVLDAIVGEITRARPDLIVIAGDLAGWSSGLTWR